MSKFYFTGSDPRDLETFGFEDDVCGKKNPKIEVDEDGSFRAIKTFPNQNVAVIIERYYDDVSEYPAVVSCYSYEGEPDNHKKVLDLSPELWIADLLEDGCVKRGA